MKKKMILVFMICLFLAQPVFADDTVDCGAFAEITKPIAQVIMIAAPILLLILGTVDFGKAVAAGNDQQMKKAVSDFVKRLLICVAILILPILINIIMGWVNFGDLTACW